MRCGYASLVRPYLDVYERIICVKRLAVVKPIQPLLNEEKLSL
jgi:hypothetical protein